MVFPMVKYYTLKCKVHKNRNKTLSAMYYMLNIKVCQLVISPLQEARWAQPPVPRT